jgi:hypothetical protein
MRLSSRCAARWVDSVKPVKYAMLRGYGGRQNACTILKYN